MRTKSLSRCSLVALGLICISFATVFSFLGLRLHDGLKTQMHDLGHLEQALWQLKQGRWSMPLSHPEPNTSRLAQHRELVLYPLSFLFSLLPTPRFLIALSAISAALAGFLLYFLARKVGVRSELALLPTVLYLASPSLQASILYDFHPIVLAFPLLVGLLICLEYRRTVLAYIVAGLLLATKEDMSFLVLFLTPFVALRYARRDALMLALAACVMWVVNWHYIPYWLGLESRIDSWERFSYLGNTPYQAMIGALTAPSTIFARLLEPTSLRYVLAILAQGGFFLICIPLLGVAALPNLLQNILDRTNWQAQIIDAYYSGIVLTLVAIGTCYALAKLGKLNSKLSILVPSLCVLLYACCLTPLPFGLYSSSQIYQLDPEKRASFEFLTKQIPEQASLVTQNNIGAHFANRENLFEAPSEPKLSDYYFFSLDDPYLGDSSPFARPLHVLLGRAPLDHFRLIRYYLRDQNLGVLEFRPPFYLLKSGVGREKNADALTALEADLRRIEESERQKALVGSNNIVGADWLRRGDGN